MTDHDVLHDDVCPCTDSRPTRLDRRQQRALATLTARDTGLTFEQSLDVVENLNSNHAGPVPLAEMTAADALAVVVEAVTADGKNRYVAPSLGSVEAHGSLSQERIEALVSRYRDGESVRVLGIEFGVPPEAIQKIARRALIAG